MIFNTAKQYIFIINKHISHFNGLWAIYQLREMAQYLQIETNLRMVFWENVFWSNKKSSHLL